MKFSVFLYSITFIIGLFSHFNMLSNDMSVREASITLAIITAVSAAAGRMVHYNELDFVNLTTVCQLIFLGYVYALAMEVMTGQVFVARADGEQSLLETTITAFKTCTKAVFKTIKNKFLNLSKQQNSHKAAKN